MISRFDHLEPSLLSTEDLLADLTPPQREAASHVDGPLLIVAGAGSGKTRVITRRVAYLIRQGIPPWSILAITFTNKAAGEMKERVGRLMDRPLRDFGRIDQPWPTLCTFHSMCLRILRHYALTIGLPANFSIYDSSDQNKLIKEATKALDISATNFPPSTVHGSISNAKNHLLGPDEFAGSATDFYAKTVARIYRKYQQLLVQNNALDFDDLMLRTAHAFRSHPQVLAELQERWQYILIDEYQDTNHAQYVLAHALALKHRNLCVVGDPDQSIYAWRGADIRNILDFETDYPDAKVVRLEQNYRSTKTILALASGLIARNTQRKKKDLWTENDQGDKATLLLAEDEHDEARLVTQRLKALHENGNVEWNQMAIFYRMNALSRVMEDALRRENLPYQMARGVEFYNRKEIKDVLAFLRVVANPDDEVSLTRIINVPARGIGDGAVKQMQSYALSAGKSLWSILLVAQQVPGLTTRAVNSVKTFVEIVNRWRTLAAATAPITDDIFVGQIGRVQRVMDEVVKTSGMEAYLRKIGAEELDELGNVNELINSAAEYDREHPDGTLADYLSMISLVSDTDHLKDSGGAITLMTLHAAKGLEFPVVAMIGLEEGVLPHSRARGNLNELEEERRLCFVGITRTQQKLFLSKAAYRTIRGLRERTVSSPFLIEMPQEFLEVFDHTGLAGVSHGERRDEERDRVQTEAQRLAAQFRRGQLVRHPKFGLGRVTDITDMGQHTRAHVDFNTAGKKTLILQYAQLEPVAG